MSEHIRIINEILCNKKYKNILDLGSGKTSLGTLLAKYPNSLIEGICYPGDYRKIDSIKENCKGKYNLIEMDICKEQPQNKYDLVMCHLLLGEALTFGNTLESMIEGILKIDTREICVIDYLEDIDIDFKFLKKIFKEKGFEIKKEIIIAKDKEEIYPKFIGKNYVGILFEKIV